MENFIDIYRLIGPAGVALIFVALYAVYLSVWLAVYLQRVWTHFRRDFLDLEKGESRCLRHLDRKRANPLIRIIYDIVSTHGAHSTDIRAEVAYLFHRNFKGVSNGLCWLKLISVIAPLLGLLGTVFGMVEVFQSLSYTEVPSAEVLAAGIWQALVTTVMGLCIAIPTMMVYYALILKFRGFHIEAVEHSYRALEVVQRMKKQHAQLPVHASEQAQQTQQTQQKEQ